VIHDLKTSPDGRYLAYCQLENHLIPESLLSLSRHHRINKLQTLRGWGFRNPGQSICPGTPLLARLHGCSVTIAH